jgi:hypothetical protein
MEEVKEVRTEIKTDYGTQDGSIPEEMLTVEEPVKEEAEPEKKEEAKKTEEPVVETEKPAEKVEKPTVDPEVEKLRKANAELGFNLREREREHERRLKFLEKELNEAKEARVKEAERLDYQRKLREIDHLREDDPVEYLNKRENLSQERIEKSLEDAKKIAQVNTEVKADIDRQNQVNALLIRDYPDMANQSSEIFMETSKYLGSRFTKEQIDLMIATEPDRVYDFVSIVDRDLKLRKLGVEGADATRASRVATQGAVKTEVAKTSTDPVKGLTTQQAAWARSRGWSKEQINKYAAYIQGVK